MGAYEEVIPTSSQILSKLDIGSTHIFCMHNIKNQFIRIVIESSHIFGPNVYVNAFLHIRSYAPGISSLDNGTFHINAK